MPENAAAYAASPDKQPYLVERIGEQRRDARQPGPPHKRRKREQHDRRGGAARGHELDGRHKHREADPEGLRQKRLRTGPEDKRKKREDKYYRTICHDG